MERQEALQVRVQGIPCLAEITHYHPGAPARRGIHDRRTLELVDPGDPPEPPELSYRLYDRRGYRAEWVEALVDEDDEARILQAAADRARELREEDEVAKYEAKYGR